MLVVMVTMLVLGAYLNPLPKVGACESIPSCILNLNKQAYRHEKNLDVTRDLVSLFSQSVLGALIAVNLKNTILQLADPYFLWKKSKLDCVC